MPKTLIVPVDGSAAAERALRSAQRLAAHLAPCDLVVMTASTADDDERRDYLHTLVGQATETRVRAEFVEAEPADAIAEMAGSLPDAVVCMATHGRGRVTAPLLGSVATEVLQRVTTPVLLVGPHCQADWWHFPAKLVVCWGGEGSNAILPWAREWAHDLHLELWLESVSIRSTRGPPPNPAANSSPRSRCSKCPQTKSSCLCSATTCLRARSSGARRNSRRRSSP